MDALRVPILPHVYPRNCRSPPYPRAPYGVSQYRARRREFKPTDDVGLFSMPTELANSLSEAKLSLTPIRLNAEGLSVSRW
jgi:hypothetical protein